MSLEIRNSDTNTLSLKERQTAQSFGCELVMEESLAERYGQLLAESGLAGKRLLAVCDPQTYAAAGQGIIREIACRMLTLPSSPQADMDMVEAVRAQPYDALLAIGSGTINDICKYASYLDKREYIVFPTAPSMNGYCSANASITENGHKQTFAAHLPRGVFCDLSILAKAPARLIRSGLGDSLCRPTAQADWLLSHLLWDTPYDPTPFDLLAPYEKELFAHADKLVTGDIAVMELLMKTLIVSGLGMVMAKGSYPASQGEHLIAHTMHMKRGSRLAANYHGEEIGVTTMFMARMQEKMLAHPLALPAEDKGAHEKIKAYFTEDAQNGITEEYTKKKQLMAERREAALEHLRKEEELIRERIRSVTIAHRDLLGVLQKAQAPHAPEALQWNEAHMREAMAHAKFIRNRFTFLDFL